jgi:hypothetical protein
MRVHKLTRPQLGFVIGTRAALAVGVGMLASGKLPDRARRGIGIGLVALGAITTIPAVRLLMHARFLT